MKKESDSIVLYNTHAFFGNGYNVNINNCYMEYHPFKGKTYEEIYGDEKAKEQKEKMRKGNLGKKRSEKTKSKLRGHDRTKGDKNGRFKYYYFLTPYDEVIVGERGLRESIINHKIPNTLFTNKPLKNKSTSEGWAYVVKDSFNYDSAEILQELKQIQYNFWEDRLHADHKYDYSLTHVTFVSPIGDKYYCYTKKDFEIFCKNNNFSLTKARMLRANKIDSDRMVNSTLHRWKIYKGIL